MVKASLILSLLAVACAGTAPEPGSLRVDPDTELAAPAQSVAARIYAATGVTVQVGAGDGADLRVSASLAPASALSPAHQPESCAPTCRWTGHFNGERILINRDAVPEAELERVLLHETLHAVMLERGAHLAAGVPGNMAEAGGINCLTAADLDLVCTHVACDRFVPETCAE
jgi:hypothetical protein